MTSNQNIYKNDPKSNSQFLSSDMKYFDSLHGPMIFDHVYTLKFSQPEDLQCLRFPAFPVLTLSTKILYRACNLQITGTIVSFLNDEIGQYRESSLLVDFSKALGSLCKDGYDGFYRTIYILSIQFSRICHSPKYPREERSPCISICIVNFLWVEGVVRF